MQIRLFFVAMSMMALCSCKTPTTVDGTYAYSNHEVECLGVDHDGSQTLRVWGKGKNKAQAIETAKKNAIKAVLFKGITSGTGECNKRPLIPEVNAEEKYEDYFHRFFADGGIYKQFASMKDEKRLSRQKSSDNSMENWGVVVRVYRSALKERLADDNIINH